MNADNRNLVVWLSCVCVVIYLMIVVGGVYATDPEWSVYGRLETHHGSHSSYYAN